MKMINEPSDQTCPHCGVKMTKEMQENIRIYECKNWGCKYLGFTRYFRLSEGKWIIKK